ncbi:MAG TPA: hypothetical protein VEV41_12970 [Terriglobales bacterium]|nr:hypothetical protein [Terriglobales bacterium]
MGWFLTIDAVAATFVLTLWYLWFARYNRRKGLGVLHWVQTACAGKGRVLKVRWQGSSRLLAELRFPPHMFEHARVVVWLLPRAVPTNWALSRWRKQKETLSFEADLDSAPRFQLEVHNHRWSGHNSGSLASRNWMVSRPGPIVLTSRNKWGQELSPVINALMASREKNFVSIRYSPESPHFSATLEIDSLPDEVGAQGWLEALRELAAGASASRH